MKSILQLICGILFLIPVSITQAQDQPASLGSSVTKALEMYVFPAKGQSDEQLAKDEDECYQWAVKQSGVDPLNLPETEVKQADTSPDGSAVRGAARGAAAGAAIGAIAGDAGQGAAIGAAAGAMRGRRASKVGNAREQQANAQEAVLTQEEMINSFKKAFAACLEGKNYTVK